MKKLSTWVLLMGLGFVTAMQSAHAFTLTANGGYSLFGGDAYGNSPKSPLVGGELTVGLGLIDVGAFYDYNTSLNGTSLSFYGGVARVTSPVVHLFVDAKVGVDKISNSDSALGLGAGVGYQIMLAPLLSLSPRVGYRYLPVKVGSASIGGNSIDFGALLSLGF